MGTIVAICIAVAIFYYFKGKKKKPVIVDTPSDRSATIRFTDDSEEEFIARREKFATMLQESPQLVECYNKVLGAFIPNKKKEFAGFFTPTDSDRAKILKETAFTAMDVLKYNTDDYVTWSQALYDDLIIRMNAKKIMSQSVAAVLSDMQQGDDLLESTCGIKDILKNAGDGNKSEFTTSDYQSYKFKFKSRNGELFCIVPSKVYSLFYEGVSFDSFQRGGEILIAICGYYKDPKYKMSFHQDIPSYDTFLSRQSSNNRA